MMNPSYMMQELAQDRQRELLAAGARHRLSARADAVRAAKVPTPQKFARTGVVAKVRHALVANH